MPDLPTIRLCSLLASGAFALVYLSLWFGRRGEGHLLLWGTGSALYVVTLLGFALAPNLPLVQGFFFVVLAASSILVLAGVYRIEGEPPFRPWMVPLALGAALGYALPAHLLGAETAGTRISATLGEIAVMATVGGILVFGRQDIASRGRRIAGLACLGYLPGYVAAIVCELSGGFSVNVAALLPILSDQVLLPVLNVSQLAIPWERTQIALRAAAGRDPLTGALNRAGLDAAAARLLGEGAAVVVIDVDHFKGINDGHGHAVGDRVLAALADGVRTLLPQDGALARLGGDEFAAILPGASPAQAQAFADALRACLRRVPDLPPWTVSLGIGAAELGAADLAAAIARADASLYRAKAQGRDRAA